MYSNNIQLHLCQIVCIIFYKTRKCLRQVEHIIDFYNIQLHLGQILQQHFKTFDFSTLYTTIPHSKLKNKLRELVQLHFIKKNGQRRYKYLVLGRDRSYFVKKYSDSTKTFSETDIINMLEFLIDNIFVTFAGGVFQQTVGIPMGKAVLLFSLTCSFIRMRQTSYRGF